MKIPGSKVSDFGQSQEALQPVYNEIMIESVMAFVPQVLQLRQKNIWLSYDEEADVLYVNFKKPNRADDSELLDNDVIVRYEGDEIVGMTVLNASKKVQK